MAEPVGAFSQTFFCSNLTNYSYISSEVSMKLTTVLPRVAVAAALLGALSCAAPAHAQFGGDAFSAGDTGTQVHSSGNLTGSQTDLVNLGQAPMLQGATFGTIGPQAGDATVVSGINTAGTVRVNNLANLEALLNIIANGMEILGIAWGGPTMIMGFMHMAAGTQDAMKRVLFGCAGVTGGLATPGAINWLVASARDAGLFS
jgi:hypothetical protein